MKKGIVLEGGAMRGMFTCGVIDVLMENNIEVDGGIGTSAGAVFGCNYKSKQIGRPIRYNKRFCNDSRYAGWKSWLFTGDLYNKEFAYGKVPYELDPFDNDTYVKNPMEFIVTCTDIETGLPVYHLCENGEGVNMDWFRASASMPIVSNIVEIGNLKLLDGGVGDSIPVKFLESLGYDRNIVVLTQPLGYIKEKNSLLPIIKLRYHKYPEFIKAVANRHIHYNATTAYIREKELKGELFVIRPDESLHIGSMEKDPNELERVYQLGRSVATRRIEELKEYLKD